MHTALLLTFVLRGFLEECTHVIQTQKIANLMKKIKDVTVKSIEDAEESYLIRPFGNSQIDNRADRKQRGIGSSIWSSGSFADKSIVDSDQTLSAFKKFSDAYLFSLNLTHEKEYYSTTLGSKGACEDILLSIDDPNTSEKYWALDQIVSDSSLNTSSLINNILDLYNGKANNDVKKSLIEVKDRKETSIMNDLLEEVKMLDFRQEYFEEEQKFIYSLVSISSFVISLNLGRDKEAKSKTVKKCLRFLNSTLTKHVYLPMIPKDGKFYRILRIAFNECISLNSRERVPIMVFLEAVLDDCTDYGSDDEINTEFSSQELESHILKKELRAIEIHEDWQSSPTSAKKKRVGDLDSIFGESWKKKKKRIREKSPIGKKVPNWDLVSVVVKSGDDLRQEQLASCLIGKFDNVMKRANLDLWVRPFEVLAVSSDAGLIETLHDTISIDALRSTRKNLREHFILSYGSNTEDFKIAQNNFVQSLAGYSLVCYLFSIKDRHNGNILLDREGHIIHIDYGFMLTTSPGSLRFERAPFKLTSEYVEVMGGKREDNQVYNRFYNLFEQGFLEVRKYWNEFISIVETVKIGTKMPCLKNPETIKEFKDKFQLHLGEEEAKEYARKLIKSSLDSFSTSSYDEYQFLTNKIK